MNDDESKWINVDLYFHKRPSLHILNRLIKFDRAGRYDGWLWPKSEVNSHNFYALLDCETPRDLTSNLADDNCEISAFHVWHNKNGASFEIKAEFETYYILLSMDLPLKKFRSVYFNGEPNDQLASKNKEPATNQSLLNNIKF